MHAKSLPSINFVRLGKFISELRIGLERKLQIYSPYPHVNLPK
jgi:hypothetical protein